MNGYRRRGPFQTVKSLQEEREYQNYGVSPLTPTQTQPAHRDGFRQQTRPSRQAEAYRNLV